MHDFSHCLSTWTVEAMLVILPLLKFFVMYINILGRRNTWKSSPGLYCSFCYYLLLCHFLNIAFPSSSHLLLVPASITSHTYSKYRMNCSEYYNRSTRIMVLTSKSAAFSHNIQLCQVQVRIQFHGLLKFLKVACSNVNFISILKDKKLTE